MRDQHGEFAKRSSSLRSVRSEKLTTSEYLSPVLQNRPDFGERGHGQKTHLSCHQFDYTCGIHRHTVRCVGRCDRSSLLRDTISRRSISGMPFRASCRLGWMSYSDASSIRANSLNVYPSVSFSQELQRTQARSFPCSVAFRLRSQKSALTHR